ncbi:MAG: HD domain-containing protein [Desulfuromonadaceae bacterium]
MSYTDPAELIRRFYPCHSLAYAILWRHSNAVARKACSIASALSASQNIDIDFVYEAAMLHDIGIMFVHAPDLGCYGEHPYIMHGLCGAELLRKEGLERHALVCENHIGVGLSVEDIEMQQLPLPKRDMLPQDIETRIIAYADLFFSKHPDRLEEEKTPAQVRKSLEHFSPDKAATFDAWHRSFAEFQQQPRS